MNLRTVLVTGASGKIGRALVPELVRAGYAVRVTEFRTPAAFPGIDVEVARGSLADGAFVAAAVAGVDAILHLATCKEDRDNFFDTSLRGTFHLLDEAKRGGRLRQFLLASGDAALGIFYRPQPVPLSETAPLAAYPGYYAFSKAMEEAMVEQYRVQYGLPTTTLRVSWVHAADDLLAHLLLTGPGFGGPRWSDLPTTPAGKRLLESGSASGGRSAGASGVGCLVHPGGRPFIRHIVGLRDVISAFLLALGNPAAIGQTFHIAGPAPFAYDVAAGYVAEKLGLGVAPFTDAEHHDFSIDLGKARAVLGYAPQMDVFRIADEGIALRRRGEAAERQPPRYAG